MRLIAGDRSIESDPAERGGELLSRLWPEQEWVALRVNGELRDLLSPLGEQAAEGQIEPLKAEQLSEFPELFRHTLSHLLAQAVRAHFAAEGVEEKEIHMGVGPATQTGFYYDFDLPRALSEDELPAIEQRMHGLVSQDLPLRRAELSRQQAEQAFAYDPFKLEILSGLPEGAQVSTYSQGDFTDLCRGPHLPRTGLIPQSFRLTSTSGAYWRGDERRPMLQRIYGVAFATEPELEAYLTRLEEAKRRDHRKLGKELELFATDPMVGKGLVLWLPKGTLLREELISFLRAEQRKRGYQEVVTPHIGNLELYKTSGHYPYYADSQFAPIRVDDEEYLLKPMNCPHHIRIYAQRPRSYRELPIRMSEFGTLYRYELSGELNGLTRVRGFTQDDGHIFCRQDQLKEEFLSVLDLTLLVFRTLTLQDVRFRVGTRDPGSDKYVGGDAVWDQSERQILEAVQEVGLEYSVAQGDAAFYGPKLDLIVKDAIGRDWQLGTIQVDYNLPERFNLHYVGQDGGLHRPVMVHRAPFGSLERMIGILIEHFAGDFPLWLAPEQVRIIPITDRHLGYAEEVARLLQESGFRAGSDAGSERMSAKVRSAELAKVAVTLVVGDREEAERTVSLRGEGGKSRPLSLPDLLAELSERRGRRSA